MAPLTRLLLIYAAVILINAILSGFLWAKHRTALHRSLFFVWALSAVSLVAQGSLTGSSLLTTIGFLSAFPISLSQADLIARVAGLNPNWRIYLTAFAVAVVLSLVAAALGLRFWLVALPAALANAFPLFDIPLRALIRRSEHMTATAKAAAITCLAAGLHDLDYPFLRDNPEMNLLGFTLALLVVFAMSITMPAVVLERVTDERTQIEQLGQLRSRFFANISHELRTPLTMILAPLESLLAEELRAPDRHPAGLPADQPAQRPPAAEAHQRPARPGQEGGRLSPAAPRAAAISRPLLDEVVGYAAPAGRAQEA